jgi:alpha-glucosidase (family GH31 glycosyl hydrolase)
MLTQTLPQVSVRRIESVWKAMFPAACLALALNLVAAGLSGQVPSFSSSAEYRSMLNDLRQRPILPSRMSAGTLLKTTSPLGELKVRETPHALQLQTEGWRLELLKHPWQMMLTNKRTAKTWRLGGPESPGIKWTRPNGSTLRLTEAGSLERQGSTWRMQVKISGSTEEAIVELTVLSPTVIRVSVRGPQTGGGAGMSLSLTGAGPFFGLGERFVQEKLDGLKTTLRPEDLPSESGHNWTYIPIPFLLTPRGMGLYLDTARVTNFDLSQAAQRRFSIHVDDSSVDCYFFLDPGPEQVLEDYTALTGRSPLPPPWAYGIWICSYQGPQKVLADARRLRQHRIPTSAIWVFDVMGRGESMGWPLWWTGYYPNPRHFTDQLHELGFKVLTYCYPFVREMLNPYLLVNPNFEKGVRDGLFVLNASGRPTGPAFEPYVDANVDFTNPRAVDWWETFIRRVVLEYNFDGWMEDFGEWVKDTDRFASGNTGRDMANLNPLFYHKITYEIARKAKPDVVEFVRSGYAGSQGYTRVVWGGDQFPDWSSDHGLPSVVRGGITVGLSGYATWGPDIDGNGFSKELWTRWVEFGALTPVMRDHLWERPNGAVDLWYDSQTIDLWRRYTRLHISLFPYFYTYAHEAAKTGLPIIRHPFLEFPRDPNTYDANEEYFLGDKILVAPVVQQGASTRALYLPPGSWADYWTGKIIKGGREVTVPAPLDQIPILVRAGSILPFISPDTQTLAPGSAGDKDPALTNLLTWRVFPASTPARDSFTLYDGTRAMASQYSSEIIVRVSRSPLARKYDVILPATHTPSEVVLDGARLQEMGRAQYQARNTGWWLDKETDRLHVLFSRSDFTLKIRDLGLAQR